MFRSSGFTMIPVGVFIVSVIITMATGTPLFQNNKLKQDPLNVRGLEYIGSTATKELYITQDRKATFQYALGFGCPIVYGSENNFILAAIETLDEVQLIDNYFATTQSSEQPVEPVWTSGIDRLGNMRGQWTSTGKDIVYPTFFQGDWSPGQGLSPIVANYNCVAIWRYCERHSNGATIPKCTPVPYGTWFTPRPCKEERRFICERSL